LIVGAALVMIPGIPLLKLAFYSQVLQGVLLPFELVLMLLIINRERIMGIYRNNRAANLVGWSTVVIVGVIALVYTAQQILGGGS
jgi:Mn2+/Fe2+ NRAMP family transporter